MFFFLCFCLTYLGSYLICYQLSLEALAVDIYQEMHELQVFKSDPMQK